MVRNVLSHTFDRKRLPGEVNLTLHVDFVLSKAVTERAAAFGLLLPDWDANIAGRKDVPPVREVDDVTALLVAKIEAGEPEAGERRLGEESLHGRHVDGGPALAAGRTLPPYGRIRHLSAAGAHFESIALECGAEVKLLGRAGRDNRRGREG